MFWEYYIRIKLRINYLSTGCNEFLFSDFYFRSFYLSFSFHISSELNKLRKLKKKRNESNRGSACARCQVIAVIRRKFFSAQLLARIMVQIIR